MILGDSVTKNIQGGKARVTSRSFSGSTVDDTVDFFKPFIRRKPDEIILHIGTNNLSNEEPQQVAEKIVDLGLSIEPVSLDKTIYFRYYQLRNDDQGLNRKVSKVIYDLSAIPTDGRFCQTKTFISVVLTEEAYTQKN